MRYKNLLAVPIVQRSLHPQKTFLFDLAFLFDVSFPLGFADSRPKTSSKIHNDTRESVSEGSEQACEQDDDDQCN